jgi:hypothetical protein
VSRLTLHALNAPALSMANGACHFCYIPVEQADFGLTWPPTRQMLERAKSGPRKSGLPKPPGGECYVGTIWDSTDKDWLSCCNCAKTMGDQLPSIPWVKNWTQAEYDQAACLNCKAR